MDRNFRSAAEAGRCILCHDAPCSRVCPEMDVASVVRSVRFGNAEGAAARIPDADVCLRCERKGCLKVCSRGKVDSPVDIPSLVSYTKKCNPGACGVDLPSLGVDFCGFRCENPFVLASSVITCSYDMCRRALEAGWGGVSVKTICYLDIHEVSPRFDVPDRDEFPFSGFKNLEQLSPNTPEYDFAWLSRLKKEFPDKLVMANIMGRDEGEWEKLARMAQEAGADVIECNYSCPQMVGRDLGSDIGQNPEMVERYTRACCRGATVPVIAKLTPNVKSADAFVQAAYRGGASGVSGINTIKSLTTVDAEEGLSASVHGKFAVSGYSGKGVKPIALRFVREMRSAAPCPDRRTWVSGIGGVETWRDALDFILLGASNVQVCTAVMQYGQRIIEDLTEGLRLYMARHGVSDLEDLVGRALPDIAEPDDLVRDDPVFPEVEQNRCISCGRCYLACRDGGHQAIELVNRKPAIDRGKCVGCHLCTFVCITGAMHVRTSPSASSK